MQLSFSIFPPLKDSPVDSPLKYFTGQAPCPALLYFTMDGLVCQWNMITDYDLEKNRGRSI